MKEYVMFEDNLMSKFDRAARRQMAVKEGHYDGRFSTKTVKSGKKYHRELNDEMRYIAQEDESLLDDEFYFWRSYEEEDEQDE